MRTRLSRPPVAGLATLALFPALAAESGAGSPLGSRRAQHNGGAARVCETVAVKHHAKHRGRTTHRFHGRSTVLHRFGKVIYVYIHPRFPRSMRRGPGRPIPRPLTLTLWASPVAPATAVPLAPTLPVLPFEPP